ncbi:MAG TPA: FMN-dependent NADH-azoreductase [Caulobacteraceae bacterium]
MKLLHIDSSILGLNSVSRQLSAQIVEREKALHPDLEVTYRDLAANGSAHLTGAHMAAWQGAPVEDASLGEDLAKGGTYLDELFAADVLVIGAPMYNFTVPTQLKAWIDRVVVAGKTFKYSETGAPISLLPTGKKVFIASSRGGAAYGEGAPAAFLEHHETYLKGILGFIGLTDVTVIRAEGLAMGPDARAAAIDSARAAIEALAA